MLLNMDAVDVGRWPLVVAQADSIVARSEPYRHERNGKMLCCPTDYLLFGAVHRNLQRPSLVRPIADNKFARAALGDQDIAPLQPLVTVAPPTKRT